MPKYERKINEPELSRTSNPASRQGKVKSLVVWKKELPTIAIYTRTHAHKHAIFIISGYLIKGNQ
jgi:hypothetical protein